MIHLVNALIADIAVAEVPEPMPVVMNQIGVVRLAGGGPEPEIKSELLGRRRHGFDTDAAPRFVAECARDQELAQFARVDDLGGRGPISARTVLRSVLNDPVVFASGLDGDSALVHVVAARFLDVNVLAGLAGPDRDQRMPVIGSRDRNGVNRLVVEDAADVLNRRRSATARLWRSERDASGMSACRDPRDT